MIIESAIVNLAKNQYDGHKQLHPDYKLFQKRSNVKIGNFAKYAWGVLVFNLLVILWGAFVRATGSGAGCGSHWPLCNGEVIPPSPQLATIIEFTHRISSGLSLLLIVILLVWAFQSFPKGHSVRLGAILSMVFIITEALIGAILVVFSWVAKNASTGRVISVALHQTNTFLLLASLTITAWWASGGRPVRLKGQGLILWALGFGLFGVLILGVSGAVDALGDTLFPAKSLAEGISQDFAPTAHILIRLRIWHPIIAITVGMYLIFVSGLISMFRPMPVLRRFVALLITIILLQLIAGLVNVLLLAPVWMQLVHLFLADMVWISLVLVATNTLIQEEV
jgi:heme A synthase